MAHGLILATYVRFMDTDLDMLLSALLEVRQRHAGSVQEFGQNVPIVQFLVTVVSLDIDDFHVVRVRAALDIAGGGSLRLRRQLFLSFRLSC